MNMIEPAATAPPAADDPASAGWRWSPAAFWHWLIAPRPTPRENHRALKALSRHTLRDLGLEPGDLDRL